MRNPDAELQQRAVEYLQMSKITSPDVLATVLEEMPPFAEKVVVSVYADLVLFLLLLIITEYCRRFSLLTGDSLVF